VQTYSVSRGCALRVDGHFGKLALPDGIYFATSIHFHFPAEHTNDGAHAVGEMQIVHKKKDEKENEAYAIVSVLLRAASPVNLSQATFFHNLGMGQRSVGLQAPPPAGQADLNAFSKELSGQYYHYLGSLTTPPCTEGVKWYVLDQQVNVDPELARWAGAGASQTAPSRHWPFDVRSSRPTQPLNGRTVVDSRVTVEYTYTTSVSTMKWIRKFTGHTVSKIDLYCNPLAIAGLLLGLGAVPAAVAMASIRARGGCREQRFPVAIYEAVIDHNQASVSTSEMIAGRAV